MYPFRAPTEDVLLKQNNWIYWAFPFWNCFLSDPNKLMPGYRSIRKWNDWLFDLQDVRYWLTMNGNYGRRWNWVLNNNHKRAVLPFWMDCWWSSYGIDSHKKETKSVIDYCNINKTPLARYLSVIYLYFTLRDVLARFLNVRCSVGHCPGYEGPWSAVINNSIYRRGSFSRGIERGEKTLDSQTVVGIKF